MSNDKLRLDFVWLVTLIFIHADSSNFCGRTKKNQFRVDEVPGDLKSWRGKKKSLGDERLKCVGCRTKSKRGWIGFHHGHRHSVCYTNAKVLFWLLNVLQTCTWESWCVFYVLVFMSEREIGGRNSNNVVQQISKFHFFFFLLFYSFFPSRLLIIVWSSMGIIRWLQWAFTILTLRCTQPPVFFRPHLLLFFSKLLLPIVLIPKRSFAISPLTLYTSL